MKLQQVTVNGIVSESIELEQGVPQATVLGPLLLNSNINNFSNQIKLVEVLI